MKIKVDSVINHLFRHHYGKMVATLTKIFGLSHLEIVEDAIQDTFTKAVLLWRDEIPENPEAWLTAVSKNRTLDLFRKIKSEKNRNLKFDNGPAAILINDLFLDSEIEDSQLRMIFTACHPVLDSRDQIAFALKTISGFSIKEIAAALLLKNETVKKRLSRARKTIRENDIKFDTPDASDLISRLSIVHKIIYVIFNEGFHSTHGKKLVVKDLCSEAIRLIQLILSRTEMRNGAGYALCGLMCFHSSRIDSKITDSNESVDLKNQDRSQWYFPLIQIGNDMMHKAMDYDDFSQYHIEAAIAAEHLKAKKYELTDWRRILSLYKELYEFQNDEIIKLNIAFVLLQLEENDSAKEYLDAIQFETLEQRSFLFFGVMSEYYKKIGEKEMAIKYLIEAIEKVTNKTEKEYLQKKLNKLRE